MQDDVTLSPAVASEESVAEPVAKLPEVVSTHVLVPEHQVDRLRELSHRTRIAQSEYLREAVDDLLVKYGKLTQEDAKEEA
jgi:hypothetical protein